MNFGGQKEDKKEEEERDESNIEVLSVAPVLLEPIRGYMYYVTELAGQCRIYEISPTFDQK